MEKFRYYLALFVYSMKYEERIFINTLFRYVYIYIVSFEYLTRTRIEDDELLIDKEIGVANYYVLYEALQSLNSKNMITMIDAFSANIGDQLDSYISGILSEGKVILDLRNIAYFVSIVSNYSDDVILSVFYNEPNVRDATNRNEDLVKLSDNKLQSLLEEFESIANKEYGKNLDKYDVFTTWLDFIFEKYVEGKEHYEQ